MQRANRKKKWNWTVYFAVDAEFMCVGHYTFHHMNNKYLYNGAAFWKLSTFILQSEIVWRDIRIAQNGLINAFQIGHNGTETILKGKKKKLDENGMPFDSD